MIVTVNSIPFNSVNKLMFVMVKCGVLFEVWAGFLNIIYTTFNFRGLNCNFVPKHNEDSITILRMHAVCETTHNIYLFLFILKYLF
jgi:hypothetical protein